MEFIPFTKIARLSRECVITEKIDGTNASIFIGDEVLNPTFLAGSRTRWITPENDNQGFARWAYEHKDELMQLGPGHHFGEWWGRGIQRAYNQPTKRFSLFNVSRWHEAGAEPYVSTSPDPRVAPKSSEQAPACCSVVPMFYRGKFTTWVVEMQVEALRTLGSVAAPGFITPEGVVVYHTAANLYFKKTLDNDAERKGPRT